MAGNSNGLNERLDALLEAMPRIAEAVKAFPEDLQSQAFDAMMAELSKSQAKSASGKSAKPSGGSAKTKKRSPKESSTTRTRRAGGPTSVKELDLHPEGKDSFETFVDEKKPTTNHDRNVVSVFYLKKVADIDKVSMNHVFTCYKDMGWREPANLANSLALTANRKRYLDTSDLDDIRLTPAGRNHVKHDLPKKTKD